MRQKRFLIYLLVQLIVILGVVLIFNLIEDKRAAATTAGALFVLLPIALAWKEHRVAGFQRKSFYLGLLQFWVLFALPIFGLRVVYWEASFADLTFFGVPAPFLHQYANLSYLIMMVATGWNFFRRGSVEKPV